MKMIFMLGACLSLQVNANQALSLFYSQSDQFLSQWVHNGRVDYSTTKIPASYSVGYYEYHWDLNKQ